MEKEFKEEFVPYELALRLKVLGFDEYCFAFYNTEYNVTGFLRLNNSNCPEKYIPLPTFSQSFKWFRKEHGLYTSISPKKSYPDGYVSGIEWVVSICGGNGEDIGPDGVFTHTEADVACLEKLIEIVES